VVDAAVLVQRGTIAIDGGSGSGSGESRGAAQAPELPPRRRCSLAAQTIGGADLTPSFPRRAYFCGAPPAVIQLPASPSAATPPAAAMACVSQFYVMSSRGDTIIVKECAWAARAEGGDSVAPLR